MVLALRITSTDNKNDEALVMIGIFNRLHFVQIMPENFQIDQMQGSWKFSEGWYENMNMKI